MVAWQGEGRGEDMSIILRIIAFIIALIDVIEFWKWIKRKGWRR